MEFLDAFLPIIIYILLIVLIIILIIISLKVNKTIDKVNNVVDDVNDKMQSLNGLFTIVDSISGKFTFLSDKFLGFIMSLYKKIFGTEKGKDDKDE